QAEDGIRDFHVTGVQTCALPIFAYFDQHRSQLDESRTALENVAEGRDFVEINGSRKHVIGYLQDFLFSPERARAPITRLSGGERSEERRVGNECSARA